MISTTLRIVRMSQQDALMALYELFTWFFEDWGETNPFLRVISPAPGCGKSTLLKVMSRLCRSSWLVCTSHPQLSLERFRPSGELC